MVLADCAKDLVNLSNLGKVGIIGSEMTFASFSTKNETDEKDNVNLMYLVFFTYLSDVFEVNGGIEVGDILDARLDHQVLLACVGEGAKGHNPLWGG